MYVLQQNICSRIMNNGLAKLQHEYKCVLYIYMLYHGTYSSISVQSVLWYINKVIV